ncbi:hypothetical protein pb186bvf_008621 [Paramecium bursaria]
MIEVSYIGTNFGLLGPKADYGWYLDNHIIWYEREMDVTKECRDYYYRLENVKNFIYVLDGSNSQENTIQGFNFERRSNSALNEKNNDFIRLKMLQRLQAKNIMIVFNNFFGVKASFIDWIKDQLDIIFNDKDLPKEEQNPLNLPIPNIEFYITKGQKQFYNDEIIQNEEEEIKTFKEAIIKFFQYQNPSISDQLLFQVLIAFPQNKQLLIRMLGGSLQKEQLVSIKDGKFQVDSIFCQNKEVDQISASQIAKINITMKKQYDVKPLDVGIGYFKQIQYYQKIKLHIVFDDITHEAIQPRIRKPQDVTVMINGRQENSKNTSQANAIIENGQPNVNIPYKQKFMPYEIELTLKEKTYFVYPKMDSLVFVFEANKPDTLVYYGRIVESTLQTIEEPFKQFLLLPEYAPQTNPKYIIQINNQPQDLRYLCRICKEQKAKLIVRECGHLRYCSECIQQCHEAKECFFCSQKMEKFFDSEIVRLKLDNKLNKDDLYIKLTKQQPYSNFSYTCRQCDKLYRAYQYCPSDHIMELCTDCKLEKGCLQVLADKTVCGKQLSEKKLIQFEFPDE